MLSVRSGTPNSDLTDWKLQRSTGNWSTAWLNGEEVDRKTVIGRLTQANWLDTVPRQQALESLFRATHLFGQDEQELLTAFQKSSVIPEAFISEMLALQDYSQGLSKVSDVLHQLSVQGSTIDQELTQLRDESSSLATSLPKVGSADPALAEPTPIEEAIAGLRQKILSSGISDHVPPDSPSLAAYSEWQELTSAQADAAVDRIHLAQALREELPNYQRRMQEGVQAQKRVEELDQELEGTKAQEREISHRLDTSTTALNEAESSRRQREQRRRDLRSAAEAQSERHDLSKQVATLQTERDLQALERSEADSRLIASEAALSKALASHSEAERAVASVRSELTGVESLLEDLPQLEQDTTILADIQTRLAKAQNELQEAEERQTRAAKAVQEARFSREALLPDYERALAEQADLDALLDSIQVHVHEKLCPLCGSQFDSVEDLLARIRRQRDSV